MSRWSDCRGWSVAVETDTLDVTSLGSPGIIRVPVATRYYLDGLTVTPAAASAIMAARAAVDCSVQYAAGIAVCRMGRIELAPDEALALSRRYRDPLDVLLPRLVVRLLSWDELMAQEE